MEETYQLQQLFRLGLQHLKASRYSEAQAIYRLMLNEQPDVPEVHHCLGLAYKGQRHWEQAIAAFRRALELRPHFPQVYNSLGETLREMNRPAESIESFHQALRQQQDFAEAWNNLGIVFAEMHQPQESIEALRRVVSLRPKSARAYNNLGNMLRVNKEHPLSLAALRQALSLQPDFPEALSNLALTLLESKQPQEALLAINRALALRPDFPQGLSNLANILCGLNRLEEAVVAYRKSLSLWPNSFDSWNSLGNTLNNLFRPQEAVEAYRQATLIRQDFSPAWTNLALGLKTLGQIDEAMICFSRGLALQPDNVEGQANRLYCLCFHPDFDDTAIFHEARQWNERFARPLSVKIKSHDNELSSERRLRIGYVSSGFNKHCQSLFTLPLLTHHDHDGFEIFCYSNVSTPDGVTARIQSQVDAWRDISTLTDQAAADLIRQDKIDILVDLTLHMAGSRLLVFARKPAPIQVTWLGYPGTTGLDAIDYRLTDPRLDPPTLDKTSPAQNAPAGNAITPAPASASVDPIAEPQSPTKPDDHLGIQYPFYSERSIHLPDTFWCYDPRGVEENQAAALPDTAPLPALTTGHMTFGCLNNFSKVTNQTLALWAQAMAALPNSQLILLAPPGSHRQRVIKHLGVSPERVRFVAYQPRLQYLETYRQIDLCLDTIPCNGHTTSLDSLWMGVPIVTRVAAKIVGRAGWSYLYHLGLMELVAWTDEEFVKMAIACANDLDRLSGLRKNLRQRLEQSPLMDSRRFARNIEAAYQLMWQNWRRQHA